jgi:hypothetical protein
LVELKTLTSIGKQYGDYWILPLTLKECAEIKPDTEVLLDGWVFAVDNPGKREVFDKWITKKIRNKKGEPVTLKELEEKDYTVPWLKSMIVELLLDSGFPLPKGASQSM